MTIGGIQLRAILFPVGVAALSIAALSWYGFVWIPAQQQYLTERNIRLLSTMSLQIQSKVNSFDLAIDNALESFQLGEHGNEWADFKDYVSLFAPELDILSKQNEWKPTDKKRQQKPIEPIFTDPPRVEVEFDEGKRFVYLFYSHTYSESKAQRDPEIYITAKTDIGRVVSPFLSSRSEFDAVALVDSEGQVLALHSPSGMMLSGVNQLAGAASALQSNSQAKGSQTNDKPTTPTGPEKLQANGEIDYTVIGGTRYRLYTQPVQLSLKNKAGKGTEQWSLIGLVRDDHFRAASSAISPTYWLMLSTALLVLCLALPLMKLRVLSVRERLHRSDGVWVAVASFLITGLLSFVLLDAYYYFYKTGRDIDVQLKGIAIKIQTNLKREVFVAGLELDTLIDESRNLNTKLAAKDLEKPKILKTNGKFECRPIQACKQSVLVGDIPENVDSWKKSTKSPYPYFNNFALIGPEGDQKIKSSTARSITPFVTIKDMKFYPDLQRRQVDSSAPNRGISMNRSTNTGEALMIFWKALYDPGDKTLQDLNLSAATLSTKPVSVVNPVLPQGIQFALLDIDGLVQFHSDPTRNLNENFFQESGNDPSLRALVLGRTEGTLTTTYLGREQRLFVAPMELPPDQFPSFRVPQWSLVVFQDSLIPSTVNLETLTLAALLFAAFGCILAAGWSLSYLIWPDYLMKWFWPIAGNAIRYRQAAGVNAGSIAVFVVLNAIAPDPSWILFGAALIATGSLVATFAIVRLSSRPQSSEMGWHRDFLLARVSLLFVVAALPAIACFQAAHHFESSLFDSWGQIDLENQFEDRSERIAKDLGKLGLCPDHETLDKKTSVKDLCKTNDTFLKRRSDETFPQATVGANKNAAAVDLDIQPFTRNPADPKASALVTGRVEKLLAWGHFAYNDVASDLKTAIDMRSDQESLFGRWMADAAQISFIRGTSVVGMPKLDGSFDFIYLLVIAAIAIGLFLLVRLAVLPLFLLDLIEPPGLRTPGSHNLRENLLLVGPPGSGKSGELRNDSRIRVFDVRTLEYVRDADHHVPVDVPKFPPETAAPNFWSKKTVESPAIPDDGTIGIDHLEYRLDDPSFQDRLLTFLEDLLYRRNYRVWIASARAPLNQLEESGTAVDFGRWRRLFKSFRLENVGLGSQPDPDMENQLSVLLLEQTGVESPDLKRRIIKECAQSPWMFSIAKDVIGRLPHSTPDADSVLFDLSVAAEPFYQAIWTSCSKDEKLTLIQIADQGVVNPRNSEVVARVMRSGLVRRDRTFRVMNKSFKHFVLHQVPSSEAVAWEHEGVRLPWGSVTAVVLTLAIGLAGVLVLTQQQLMDSWTLYVPALAPALPTVMKLFSSLQPGSKSSKAT